MLGTFCAKEKKMKKGLWPLILGLLLFAAYSFVLPMIFPDRVLLNLVLISLAISVMSVTALYWPTAGLGVAAIWVIVAVSRGHTGFAFVYAPVVLAAIYAIMMRPKKKPVPPPAE